jgi:hypothetical protein
VARSTKKHSDKDVDRRPHDRSEDIVEDVMDDDEDVMDDDEAVMDDDEAVMDDDEAVMDDDEAVKDIVEAVMDDDEVVVDGFQRVSVLGLEVMMVDGPVRVRTLSEPDGQRRKTDRRG